MDKTKFRVAVAVFVGVILILGVISCFFVQDQTTMVMLAIMAALYVVYLVKLIPMLKKKKASQQASQSPLSRRK